VVPVIENSADATPESSQSVLNAIARTVQDEATVNGPEYWIPVVELGVDPSMVYRIDAPSRVLVIVTCCGLV
jgi:hypothetical protein